MLHLHTLETISCGILMAARIMSAPFGIRHSLTPNPSGVAGSARPSAAGQEFAARLAEASGPAHQLSRAASLDRNAQLARAAPLERGASLDRQRPSAPSFSAWSPGDHKGEALLLYIAVHQAGKHHRPQGTLRFDHVATGFPGS